MPTYEYKCGRCLEEESFSMSVKDYAELEKDPTAPICGTCGSMDMQRKWRGIAAHVEHAD
jgi:predicted nucleic acid-binding Zn ribbon protein